jgi:hypothetical protein
MEYIGVRLAKQSQRQTSILERRPTYVGGSRDTLASLVEFGDAWARQQPAPG